MVELIDGAAVKLVRSDKFVTRLHERVENTELGGMAGGNAKPRRSAFKRCNALFQHGGGGIRDAGINIAKRLKAKEGGRLIHIVKHETRGLIDRRDARAGCRIGCGTCVNCLC